MKIEDLRKPLSIDQVRFRVQSINKGGYATILAYKDSRVDMDRLDDVCGPMFWKKEYYNSNQNCRVSIWNDEIKEWIFKDDVGKETLSEKKKVLLLILLNVLVLTGE